MRVVSYFLIFGGRSTGCDITQHVMHSYVLIGFTEAEPRLLQSALDNDSG